MRITKRQLRRLLSEISAVNPVLIEDDDELNAEVAMKIKDIMPPDEALALSQEKFKDLVVGIYETYFDPHGEGWDPREDDLVDIENHLTIIPLPDDEDFDPDEHGRHYEEHPTYDDVGQQDGVSYSFRKNEARKMKITKRQLRRIIREAINRNPAFGPEVPLLPDGTIDRNNMTDEDLNHYYEGFEDGEMGTEPRDTMSLRRMADRPRADQMYSAGYSDGTAQSKGSIR